MCVVPPLGPTFMGESAKACGLKVRCLHGEHVGETRKIEKKILPSPPPNLKGIKTKAP